MQIQQEASEVAAREAPPSSAARREGATGAPPSTVPAAGGQVAGAPRARSAPAHRAAFDSCRGAGTASTCGRSGRTCAHNSHGAGCWTAGPGACAGPTQRGSSYSYGRNTLGRYRCAYGLRACKGLCEWGAASACSTCTASSFRCVVSDRWSSKAVGGIHWPGGCGCSRCSRAATRACRSVRRAASSCRGGWRTAGRCACRGAPMGAWGSSSGWKSQRSWATPCGCWGWCTGGARAHWAARKGCTRVGCSDTGRARWGRCIGGGW